MLVVVADRSLPRDRLDKLVVAAMKNAGSPASRAEVQRWIAAGLVTVDGAPSAASATVTEGATVEIRPAAPQTTTAVPDPSVHVPVVYEDDDILVIDKPANLVVHPAKGNWEGTLVHGLLAREGFGSGDEDIDNDDGSGLPRPGIVHRLDKGTSGLLVVAKNAAAREALKAKFAAHDIERQYVAIVTGAARTATFDTPYGRHPRDRLRFTSKGRVSGGRRAVTHVRVIEELGPATLVACTLETGRTHQIRVHLSEQMGSAVLGDPRYGKRPKDPLLARLADEIGRQALHARVLGFSHPRTGAPCRWESPIPEDMARVLTALRDARG